VIAVVEAIVEKRDAAADAAALDAALAAGKRLRPPPTRFETPTLTAGELALRREQRAGTAPEAPTAWETAHAAEDEDE
jgi:hypothetical protein